jgi:hypothetical protein
MINFGLDAQADFRKLMNVANGNRAYRAARPLSQAVCARKMPRASRGMSL